MDAFVVLLRLECFGTTWCVFFLSNADYRLLHQYGLTYIICSYCSIHHQSMWPASVLINRFDNMTLPALSTPQHFLSRFFDWYLSRNKRDRYKIVCNLLHEIITFPLHIGIGNHIMYYDTHICKQWWFVWEKKKIKHQVMSHLISMYPNFLNLWEWQHDTHYHAWHMKKDEECENWSQM